MSVLDEVATKVKSAVGAKLPTTSLLDALVEYLGRSETGGLHGLVQKFEKAGLGAQIQSWIGTGTSLPITPDEVTRALGSTDLSQIATKAGIPVEQASQQLATLLPDAVNHLTPAGKLPVAEKLGGLFGSLKDKFSK